MKRLPACTVKQCYSNLSANERGLGLDPNQNLFENYFNATD